MIRLEEITLGYGGQPLIERASATLRSGELTALVGRNGSGKSTLLRAIAGVGPYHKGRILLQGSPLEALSPVERAHRIALVTTERIRIAHLRCRDAVALGRAPHTNWIGRMQPQDESVVAEALRLVEMESYADRRLESLSDGEHQRIMIARALAQQTPILLLDEPTSFLDLPNRYELGALLARLAREEQKCILFSTHELDIALSLAHSIALIDSPHLRHLPTEAMIRSGYIEPLFSNSTVRFDAASRRILLQ